MLYAYCAKNIMGGMLMTTYFFNFLFLKGQLSALEKCTINGKPFGISEATHFMDAEAIPKKWLRKGCFVQIADSLTVLFLKWPSWSKNLSVWSYTLPHINAPLPSKEQVMQAEPSITRLTRNLCSFGFGYKKLSEDEDN